ncbi:MAG: FAD/NAD(P)-binding protein [Anaerolineae bacterium]|nr:FAD/NAD(P)-binding protein [Anaerolineae bacterium]NUQ04031.1 FAD/NAD(P)-binding protein [Anaerolineae bacterium]
MLTPAVQPPAARLYDPMLPSLHRVEYARWDTDDTFSLELARVDGATIPPFEPGQFNMLYVYGVGEIPISISGDPARRDLLVHTTRAVGTVTRAMSTLKVGDSLGVRGPFGTTWPVDAARGRDVVIVAGGIGLAPLRPAMYRILAHREHYNRVVLLYGARTPGDVLYRKELEQWRAHFDLDVFVTVDRATGSWRGSVGLVTSLIGRAPFDPLNTAAMVCGPEVMMRFTAAELEKRGVKGDLIYVSMERNMKCAIGLCGHCQYGPFFICKDGPVFPYRRVQHLLSKWEI